MLEKRQRTRGNVFWGKGEISHGEDQRSLISLPIKCGVEKEDEYMCYEVRTFLCISKNGIKNAVGKRGSSEMKTIRRREVLGRERASITSKLYGEGLENEMGKTGR